MTPHLTATKHLLCVCVGRCVCVCVCVCVGEWVGMCGCVGVGGCRKKEGQISHFGLCQLSFHSHCIGDHTFLTENVLGTILHCPQETSGTTLHFRGHLAFSTGNVSRSDRVELAIVVN